MAAAAGSLHVLDLSPAGGDDDADDKVHKSKAGKPKDRPKAERLQDMSGSQTLTYRCISLRILAWTPLMLLLSQYYCQSITESIGTLQSMMPVVAGVTR